MDIPTSTTVALSELWLGDGEVPGVVIDSRITGREEGIDALAASIAKRNLLQPLGVWFHEPSAKEVIAFGNRRLRALRILRDQGALPDSWPVPCVRVVGNLGHVLDASAAENIDREPLHPVDVYEVTASLKAAGMSDKELGERFRVSIKTIKQRLSLGRLAQPILDAWRAGEVGEDVAKAFTLEPDHTAQMVIFTRLKASRDFYGHRIREAILGDQHLAGKYLKLVGEAAYAKAGGRLVADLFEDRKGVLDRGVLDDLVDAKLADSVTQLTAEGWGHILTERDKPENWYAYDKIGEPAYTDEEQAELTRLVELPHHKRWAEEVRLAEAARIRTLSAEDRAAAHALVSVSHDGEIHFELGRVPPAAKGKAKAADGEEGAASDGEPQRVVDGLRVDLSLAIAETLATDPHAALQAAVATFLVNSHSGSPVILRLGGHYDVEKALPKRAADDLQDAIVEVCKMSADQLLGALAEFVAKSIDASSPAQDRNSASGKGVTRPGVEFIASLVMPEALLANLRKNFNAVAYFAGINKAACLRAIEEALGPASAAAWGKAKKGDLAQHCVMYVPQTGWLPAELRFPGYAQPTAAGLVEIDPGEAGKAMADAAGVPADRQVRRRKSKADDPSPAMPKTRTRKGGATSMGDV